MNPNGAAKAPVAWPAAARVTIAVALASIALGAVAFRDALLAAGAITGAPWLVGALHRIDGLTARGWMVPAGLAAAVLGVGLLLVAVAPRRRTHRPLVAPDAWVARRDVAPLASTAVAVLTGVGAATATSSARTVTIAITPLAGYDANALTQAAQAAVTDALAPMARPPRVRIRLHERKPS